MKVKQNLFHIKTIAVLIALLTLAGTIPVFAAPKEGAKTVKVGYYENEIFQEGAAKGAVKTGYAYEYYCKLSEYTGWKYEYVYGSITDLYQMLVDGKIDLMAGLAYKDERKDIIGYPETIMGSESYNLVKHDDAVDITADPSTLNGKTIGVLDSAMVSVLNEFLDNHNVKAKIVTYSYYEALFSDFDNKVIDILAAEGDGAYHRNHAEVLCEFGTSGYYLCVNKNRPDLLSELNTAQTQLAAEEPFYLNTLNSKYYSKSMSSRAFSAPEKEWLANHKTLTIGCLEHYLPYSDVDSNGKVFGLVCDYIPEILKTLDLNDLEVKYVSYENSKDMVADIGKGKIDAAFPVGGGLYYSEENGIHQTTPVVSPSNELIYKDTLTDETTSHFSINEKNLMQYYYVKTNFPDAEITFFESPEECLDAVISDKVTCTLLDGLRANDILKNRQYSMLSQSQLDVNEDRCFGVEIGNEGLLKLLNRGINVVDSNYARNLAYLYTSGLYSYSLLDVLNDNIAFVATAILIITAVIILLLLRNANRKRKQIIVTENAKRELEEKNNELAHSKEALSNALIAAEHANRAKTNFLNNMSHDIRTPMNAIVGFTAMAATHIDNKEQVQDYLSKISISSRHLLSLINDVLDMSRIESGEMKIDMTEVHLPDVIHDLWTIIQSNIKAKQLDLFIDTKDVRNEDIVTDKLRLNQALLNILSNAVKFTPPGGTVSLTVIEHALPSPDMTQFEFRVKDNGIGMSEEFQKTIFDAFTRERTSTVSRIQGTGLGMAITKNIIDLMGGTITVQSEVGKGTEFVVTLPVSISEKSAKYEQLPELKGLRALVADDNTDTCLSVCSMLRKIGMRPDWTNYGKEAVIRAKEAFDQADKFRVYIIDWLMPDMNGIETVRQIRRVIGDTDPIIILTAYDWTDIEAEAREAGVTGFCSKPLFMSELRNVLSQPFKISGGEDEEEKQDVDFTGRRILLAEDNEMNQMIAVSILESAGFEIDIADDGAKAVEKITDAEAGYYDVVLMDIQMPNMDGYEAAKRIRSMSDKKKASVPIIAVTANAFEEDRIIALEAGMNGHLAKPYDIPMMMETLKEVFDNEKTEK